MPRLQNLVVLRGFTKAYSLGGMRVGFAVASPGVAAQVRAVLAPLQVGELSLRVAMRLLAAGDPCARLRQRIRAVRPVAVEALTAAGLRVRAGHADVPAVVVDDAAGQASRALGRLGIRCLRPPTADAGIVQLRVPIGDVRVRAAAPAPRAMTTAVASGVANTVAAATASELLGRRAPDIRWAVTGSEQTAQGLAGLMALHGDAGGAPRGLRLAVASVAAGVLAAQGALAAQVARRRGCRVTSVETSALAGALMFASHHIAVAGAVSEASSPGRSPSAPPFRSADGCWFELEATSFDAWAGLWQDLGASQVDAADGLGELRTALRDRLVRAAGGAARVHAGGTASRTIEACAAASGVAAIRVREAAGRDVAPWRLQRGSPARPPQPARPAPALERPLAGIRVVELTSRLQGPLAGRLLHWLGADVVKLEPPGGDPGRLAPGGPFRGAYLAYNHGKRFAELDYRTAAGRSELAAIVAEADVFLHNARPGRAERYGFDAAQLERARPGLVHVQLAGWDPVAGRGDTVAGDYVVQADSGVAAALAAAGDPPRPSPLTLLDVMGGLLGAAAAAAGLLERERGGRGTRAGTTLHGAASLLLRHGRGEQDGPRAAIHAEPGALLADPRTAALLAPVADGIFAAGVPWRFAA